MSLRRKRATEIIKAKHMGFCFGVRNAVDVANDAVTRARASNRSVCASGPIIHNAEVTRMLADGGLVTMSGTCDVSAGSTYIVRSHGEGPEIFQCARETGFEIADTTCPKVRRVQKIAKDAADGGATVVIVGDREHPEVVGVKAWTGGKALVVGSEDEARKLSCEIERSKKSEAGFMDNREMTDALGEMQMPTMTNVVVLSQTTMDEDYFTAIAEILERAGAKVHNTVCNATKNRQSAARELAGKVDVMFVIGDESSSNSRKLYEIARKYQPNSFFIAGKETFLLKMIENCNRIGVTAGASTPDRTIEEVTTGMSEITNGTAEMNPMHEYMEEIDKALRLPRNGDIITGEVIQITEKYVIINIGCKKDGIIPRNEVNLEPEQQLSDVFNEGEEVQAKVLKTDDGDGNILLSKKRAVVSEHWEDINKAFEEKETLEVNVIKEVNGGVIASFNEINGFIPMSQLSDRYVENADEFIGKPLEVKVMRIDPKRNKVVFSHKSVLYEARQKRMMEIWGTLHVGDIIDGKVMRFTEYGAFVDIGGIDGLLHISEISWGKLKHPEEVLEMGQEIKVKILSMSKEKEKISLGYKQNLPEPWSIIKDKYSIGQVITGTAVQIKEYGVFVEIEPGLDGLVHISEIAHKRVDQINEEINVGQEITAKILDIDKERRRISLSIKDTTEKPVEEATAPEEIDETRVPPGVPTSSDGEYKPTIGDKVKEALAEAAEAAKEKAEELAEEAREVAETVVEKVEEVAEAVSEKVESAAEAFIEKVEEVNADAPAEEEVAEAAPSEEVSAAAEEAPEAAPAEAAAESADETPEAAETEEPVADEAAQDENPTEE